MVTDGGPVAQADQAVKAWKPSTWQELLKNDAALKQTVDDFHAGKLLGVDLSSNEISPQAGGDGIEAEEDGLDLGKVQ
ncbi:MAG: hypothetical protein FJX66_10050 [Alphaproteobacteria bacterium]|nr:hypothetical protein [Alphaproteobacteria bacterium]